MTGPVSPGGRSRRCTRLVDHNHDYKQLSENYTLVTAMVLLCVQLLALVAVCAASLGPVVHIDDGILRGRYLATRNGREFSAFQAIPFARPPVGHLRFQAPEKNDPWTGTLEATSDSHVCVQRNPYVRSETIEGDEDCLYLNVYTPSKLEDVGSNLLPILVFFHGGGWVCGAGTSMWYGPNMLLDRDVILVVPNFRLGPLGFLSTGDDAAPGNAGLKDQALALKWIKKNIKEFGGDPKRITVFGESAGGVSVHLHMMSPLSKDLLFAGISQSGTALCSWALEPRGHETKNTKKLAESLDCPTDDSASLVECLRKRSAYEIIGKDRIFEEWDYDPMIPFKPVIEHEHDGAFLTQHPREIIKNGEIAQIPWITGITSSEGVLRTAAIISDIRLMDELDERFDKLIPMSLMYEKTSTNPEFVTKALKEFYFNNGSVAASPRERLIDLYTDGWFLAAADEALRLHSSSDLAPVYAYYFDHRGVASFSQIFGGGRHENLGVCHADELQYLFPVGDGLFPDQPPDNRDVQVAKVMTSLWVNFASTGVPSLDNLDWYPVSASHPKDLIEYLHIGGPEANHDVMMKKGLLTKRAEFWSKLPLHSTEHTFVKDEL